ncbi:MAG TPA: cobalt-precorrin-5B (C(1))-methyltransferase [Synechococcales bacterium UBA10510]|nr:cobalt-precorrin-5B (C(1))-methyltransferase [Synechococcales bacterium UBA10510]
MVDPPRRGYTLPVWLAAAACAAVAALRGEALQAERWLELLEPAGLAAVPVQAAAALADGWTLAESRCDPGDGLDLTRGLAVWVLARWLEPSPPGEGARGEQQTEKGQQLEQGLENDQQPWLQLEAGEGVGVIASSGQLCISAYARALLHTNLRPLVPAGRRLQLRVVLPSGRQLAERTSNAAFGVVEGLALIGTQAASQASADPAQLQRTLDSLATRLAAPDFGGELILVLGENGLDLAPRLGLPASLLLKVGNWLGPVLVAAGQGGVKRLLLFGYQGKLIKLAGGIFHTHHHLADGRAEILTALAALEGLAGPGLEALHGAASVETALAELQACQPELASRLRARLAATVERRTAQYLARHDAAGMEVGAVLFDRGRQVCAAGPIGARWLAN